MQCPALPGFPGPFCYNVLQQRHFRCRAHIVIPRLS